MFDNVREDIDRCRFTCGDEMWWVASVIASTEFEGLWAILDYRARRWVHTSVRIPVVRQLLMLLGLFSRLAVQTITGIRLSTYAEIGKGLYISHFGGIIVGPNRKLGDHCNVGHDVTIGRAGRGEKFGFPTIGSRVYVATGARVIGPVTIGDDVAVGANAVVTKDVPDRAVAVGVPAKVVSYKGSEDFVRFRQRD